MSLPDWTGEDMRENLDNRRVGGRDTGDNRVSKRWGVALARRSEHHATGCHQSSCGSGCEITDEARASGGGTAGPSGRPYEDYPVIRILQEGFWVEL